jgi:hypothetical protein
MKVRSLFISGISLLILSSCSSSKKLSFYRTPDFSLELVNEYVIPYNLQFKGTTVGGLSSIDYDARNDEYYMVSDDRSDKNPARFYKAKINIVDTGINKVEFTDVITWKDKNGNEYPSRAIDPYHTPDPESMRYDGIKNELIWSSEGERVTAAGKKTVLEDPAVNITDLNGRLKDSFALPGNMHMSTSEKGPRQNSVFEGTTFSPDHKYLFVSVEEPLYEDGPRAASGDSTAWVRIIKFDTETKKQVAQYAYHLSAIAYPSNPPGGFKVNGISEILCVGPDKFMIMERSFSSGRNSNTIRIYWADASKATDVSSMTSIAGGKKVKPLAKTLMLNMDNLGRYVDNVEGLTFGPTLPDGRRSMIFIVDNNFDAKEKAQVFLFRVLPRIIIR